MATFPTVPYQTTLGAALTADATTVKTSASGSGSTLFAVGQLLVIGKEVLQLTEVNTTTHTHQVKRGMRGSAAVKHQSGAIVTSGSASTFGPVSASGVTIAGYDGDYGQPTLPIGSRWIDQDTGYEYILVDAAASYVVGTWVSITAAGAAAILTNASKGRIGCIVEANGASDKLCWAMVVGSFSSALCAHTAGAVTTGVLLTASGTISGALGAATTCDLQQTRVFGATCTAALTTSVCPLTGANAGTVYMCNPWVYGLPEKGVLYTA